MYEHICLSVLSSVYNRWFSRFIYTISNRNRNAIEQLEKINIAFDIAIVGVILIVKWKHLIMSTVDRLEKLISIYRRDPDCASSRQSYRIVLGLQPQL